LFFDILSDKTYTGGDNLLVDSQFIFILLVPEPVVGTKTVRSWANRSGTAK
jgi:hypothetical protein